MALTCHFVLSKLYSEPSIGASYQISINLAKWFQRRFFVANNKQELSMASILVLWVARNMEILYRISHTSFPQSNNSLCLLVSEEKIFRNWPTRNKNCLWWPCLLTDRDNMSNLNRGPSIDVSYWVPVHLAQRFQWRFLKYEKFRRQKTYTKW